MLAILVDRQEMSERLDVTVHSAQVARIKPGRRAVVRLETDDGAMLAKVRVGHRASSPFKLMQQFRAAGFDGRSRVMVAEPIASFDDIEAWVQREAPGQPGDVLVVVDPCRVARAAAEAAHRIHAAGVPTRRVHTVVDELAILATRFDALSTRRPELGASLAKVHRAVCRRAARDLRQRPTCGTHRDYYHDQILIAADRVTVIDFDLYCSADPALDIGNFIAHLHEHAVRVLGDPGSMATAMSTATNRYCDLAGESHREAIAAYAHLSLARHISLSQEVPGRAHTTDTLIELCLHRNT